jgi:tRNA nucleotidyltransferase (CCA-adding enzyme)
LERVLAHPLLEAAVGALEPNVSLVGGAVRDGLLMRPFGDEVDLVVEGDAEGVARRVAEHVGGRLTVHGRFGTASVRIAAGHLDFVGARRETYAHPGALPEVERGTLDDDLRRRDFTVNAMALRLVGDEAGRVIDPTGGRDDLHRGLLRQLRPGIFAEDPSRLLRGVRYAARLSFVFEPETRAAAEEAASVLDWSNARVAEEFRRVFEEGDPAGAVALLRELGAPGLAVQPRPGTAGAIDEVLARDGVPAIDRGPLLLGRFASDALLGRIGLPPRTVALARASSSADFLAADLRQALTLSAADRRLREEDLATVIVATALGAPWAGEWLVRDRFRGLEIDGKALIDAGVPEGPAVGKGLAAARAAMLDGDAEGRDDQLRVALAAVGA